MGYALPGTHDLEVYGHHMFRQYALTAGASMADVVETTVMLADIAEFADMNEVYAEFFEPPYPARAAFQVVALPKGGKVEIKALARI